MAAATVGMSLIGGVFTLPAMADTADSPPISWDSVNALEIAAAAGADATASILNNTGEPLEVIVQVGNPAIEVKPPTINIPAGGTKAISVKLVEEPAADIAVSYTVTAITGAAPGVAIRRSVVVGPTSAVAAASSVTGVSTWIPWEPTLTADGPGLIPLTSPSACATLKPVPSPLGYLHSDRGDVGTVSATCVDQSGYAALDLSYSGLGATGATYTGDVKFGEDKVSITTRRTAGYLLPVVALLAGLAVALGILGRLPSKIIKPMQQRVLQIRAAIGTKTDPGTATKAYEIAASGALWGQLDLWTDTTTLLDGVDADLNALHKNKRFTLTDGSAEVTALKARIAAAASSTDTLPELGRTLARVQNALPVVESTNKLPAWTANVRSSLLATGPATLGGIPALRDRAAAAESICNGWSDINVQADALRKRGEALTANTGLPASDMSRVNLACGKLLGALAAFDRATSNDDVKAVLDGQYAEARQAIDELKALPVKPQRGGFADIVAPPTGTVDPIIGQDLPLPVIDYPGAIKTIATKEKLASLLTLSAVLLILVVAGLQALVVGKAFGTPFDFLLAFTWGAGSVLVAQLLAPAIEGLVRIKPTPN